MYYESPDGVSIHDGFPNPAADASLSSIDLTALLIPSSLATYLMRLSGNEWQHLGLFDGDILIVDRALNARKNDLVIWHCDGSFVISYRTDVHRGSVVWGVVTAAIHRYREHRR